MNSGGRRGTRGETHTLLCEKTHVSARFWHKWQESWRLAARRRPPAWHKNCSMQVTGSEVTRTASEPVDATTVRVAANKGSWLL